MSSAPTVTCEIEVYREAIGIPAVAHTSSSNANASEVCVELNWN